MTPKGDEIGLMSQAKSLFLQKVAFALHCLHRRCRSLRLELLKPLQSGLQNRFIQNETFEQTE